MKRTWDSIAEEAERLGIPTTWTTDFGKIKPIAKAKLCYAIKCAKGRKEYEIKRDSEKFKEITDLKKRGIL